jgi:hypothetical protein
LPPAATPAAVDAARNVTPFRSATAVFAASDRSAAPMPLSASSSVSIALGRISEAPTAFVLISGLLTALLRSSPEPIDAAATSLCPTPAVRIWVLPTLFAGSVIAA